MESQVWTAAVSCLTGTTWASLGTRQISVTKRGITFEGGSVAPDVIRSVTAVSPQLAVVAAEGSTAAYCFAFDKKEATDLVAAVQRWAGRGFAAYEPGSVATYFQYYGKLMNQQNMLQDHTRTGAYYNAILGNTPEFRGAVCMDVGAGSGVLSYFSALAGAKSVYAVEASAISEAVRAIASAPTNAHFGQAIRVVPKLLEDVSEEEIPKGSVDVLVSEPIGTLLFNERMIETYLRARDRFLKPGGKMFPRDAELCIAPFSNATLYQEVLDKQTFWRQQTFYGIDLAPAAEMAGKEVFCQPVCEYVDPATLVAAHQSMAFDFTTVKPEELEHIKMDFAFPISGPCLVHGLAGWFDIGFDGANRVVLSTAPSSPGTHWYQLEMLLLTPLAVNGGQVLEGTLTMDAHDQQSYNLRINMRIRGTDVTSTSEVMNLKDPEYRFYSNPGASYQPPEGAHIANPPLVVTPQPAQPEASSYGPMRNGKLEKAHPYVANGVAANGVAA